MRERTRSRANSSSMRSPGIRTSCHGTILAMGFRRATIMVSPPITPSSNSPGGLGLVSPNPFHFHFHFHFRWLSDTADPFQPGSFNISFGSCTKTIEASSRSKATPMTQDGLGCPVGASVSQTDRLGIFKRIAVIVQEPKFCVPVRQPRDGHGRLGEDGDDLHGAWLKWNLGLNGPLPHPK